MKKLPIFLSALFLISLNLYAQDQKMHSWTDSQGRTLQALFLKSDGSTLTINWNGQVVPIPLASLSPESQDLARKLAAEAAFGSISKKSSSLHAWTDVQGRTLEAKFIQMDAASVTIELSLIHI